MPQPLPRWMTGLLPQPRCWMTTHHEVVLEVETVVCIRQESPRRVRLIPRMAYQAAETAIFGECMTDIKVCPVTCPHSRASQDVLVQFGVDFPVGAQRRAPHRVLHHRRFSFQIHLAGELMHSYQPLGDPGPPST